MNEQEQRIREFAYEIWQTEGCPDGQGERHWEMARKLVEAENGGGATKAPGRTRKNATKPTDAIAKTETAPAAKAASASKPPRASRAAPKADTEAKAGTPETIKKPRAPRAKKES